jgi:hypothetical protein
MSALAVACGGDGEAGTSAEDSAAGDAIVDAEDAAPEALTVFHTLTPRDFLNNEVVVGLEVCAVHDPDQPCALTTQDGATLETATSEPLLFVVRSPDYLDTLYPVPASPRDQVYSFPVFANGIADAAAGILGTSLAPDRAHLLVFVSVTGRTGSPTVAGATVVFEGQGEGPFYIGDNNLPDPELSLTTGAGTGLSLNLAVTGDEVIVDVTHPERECILHGPGFPIVDNDRTRGRAPLRRAHLTHVQFRCPDP